MISRYLDRSQRAVQFWEEHRGLPIHRIPGGRGQTVFAYAAELDAWLVSRATRRADEAETDVATPFRLSPSIAPVVFVARPPGILVLPCESSADASRCRVGDTLCQQLIVRLSAVQPVRVLSWTTSRSERLNVASVESTAGRLNVRYVVETTIEHGAETLHVDVRVIDAEIDQIVLANRFAVADDACSTALAQIADGVALHFALVHAGALVEPMCLGDLSPALFLDYLVAARSFFDDRDGGTGRTLAKLDRIVETHPAFEPALALRGLALMQTADALGNTSILEEARGILASLGDGTVARVTVAFLSVAIDRMARKGSVRSTAAGAVLSWIPPSVVRHGRLYERRSALHRANDVLGVARSSDDRHDHLATPHRHDLLDELLRELMALHRCNGRLTDPQARTLQGGVYPRAVPPSANDHALPRPMLRDERSK